MKLVWKLSIPQMCILICFGLISFVVINASFTGMHERYVKDNVESRFQRITANIDAQARAAINHTAVFVRLPEVARAYEIALAGNINDGNSPQSQEARELLRRELAPMLDSYREFAGTKLQLHFHLPNGRSLARLWRDKQTRVKGEWVDISDDISSFRPTVMDVNREGRPVKGIELGSGGFAIRGVVPVTGPDGRLLGSAEVLQDFKPILDSAAEEGKFDLILYMNSDQLAIATALQDPGKNPHIGDFVRVTTPRDDSVTRYITPELLTAGKNGSTFESHGSLALATLPIADYKGNQLGVLVCAMNTEAVSDLAATAELTLAFMLAGMAIVPFLALLFGLRAIVTGPLAVIKAKIQDIAEDRADLTEQIPSRQKDEIGDLARWFNTLTAKIRAVMDRTDGYVSMLNAVPDPIFAVDGEYRMLMANRAAREYLGVDEESLQSCSCRDGFQTKVCGTPKCPIEMVKNTGGRVEAEIIELVKGGKTTFIKPSADILLDSKGNRMGYVEVARIVTALVQSEQAVNEKLERIRSVNEATHEIASHLSGATVVLERQFSDVHNALEVQQDRLRDSVAAMEQMNTAVQQVARSASEAAAQTRDAREQAEHGAGVVTKSIQAIQRVSNHAETMRQSMRKLGDEAEGIGTVLSVISDIADQTNLLALNAAIEAARAGEAGRGFAVVADEVRKLAEKTMQATGEVDKAVGSIQRGAQGSLRLVEETGELVNDASSLATGSGEVLQSIVTLVVSSSDQVNSIAAAAEEQSATSEHINRTIEAVADMASDVDGRMTESLRSVQELSGLAGKLDELSRD